jgi:hypothetical protein
MQKNPEIGKQGKLISGVLLIFFTAAAILTIIGLWPDRMPKQGQQDGVYHLQFFNVTLDTSSSVFKKDTTVKTIVTPSPDTTGKRDSLSGDTTGNGNDSPGGATADTADPDESGSASPVIDSRKESKVIIHLGTLLLILVAVAGFLGNMIHIATSFTTYVGAEKFRKSWILWYFVRPVTASGLALILYFIFRAGFLNSANDNSNLNLYGVLTLSVLAGLFTDIATQKMKEVFETVFKPKDARPDKLDGARSADDEGFLVTDVSPAKLDRINCNKIVITGSNLDKGKINVLISDTIVPQVIITKEKIEFDYTATPEEVQKGMALIVITDENGKALYTKKIPFA